MIDLPCDCWPWRTPAPGGTPACGLGTRKYNTNRNCCDNCTSHIQIFRTSPDEATSEHSPNNDHLLCMRYYSHSKPCIQCAKENLLTCYLGLVWNQVLLWQLWRVAFSGNNEDWSLLRREKIAIYIIIIIGLYKISRVVNVDGILLRFCVFEYKV